jgi:hypothetical protein
MGAASSAFALPPTSEVKKILIALANRRRFLSQSDQMLVRAGPGPAVIGKVSRHS